MLSDTSDLSRELGQLRERREQLDERVADLAEQLERARDQRDRVAAAIRSLVGDPPENQGHEVAEHTGKYRKLWEWLCHQESNVIPMTFGQVEEILGFGLPPSSRKHPSHWSGYDNSAVSRAIVDAGFKTRNVNLDAETVEMYRP